MTTTGALCTFWLAGRYLALEASLVGEVVALHNPTPIPMSHESVRGIINLRGAPVVVLDLAEVLQFSERSESRGKIGLVLRIGDLVAAAQIDRMEAVIPGQRGVFSPRDPNGDHAAVLGFIDDRDAGGRVITVLDPDVLVGRLEALRYLTDSDAE